jgi:hypothetical protein
LALNQLKWDAAHFFPRAVLWYILYG